MYEEIEKEREKRQTPSSSPLSRGGQMLV